MRRRFGNFSHRIGQEVLSSFEYGTQYAGFGSSGSLSAEEWASAANVAGQLFPESNWFRELRSGYCEALYYTTLGFVTRDDTEIAAQSLNQLLEGLRLYAEGVCRARCELSWWINMRAFGAENEDSPEQAGITHNCAEATPCQIGTDAYQGEAQRTTAEKNAKTLLAAQGVAPDYFTPDQMKNYDNCSFAALVVKIVNQYNALRAEYSAIIDQIEYEKSQRSNLVKLRDEKQIEDWYLSVMYPDREERMASTNPDSKTGSDYIEDEKTKPYIWLGIVTALSIGTIVVANRYMQTRGGK